jgi:beta-glucuronidase
VSAALQSTEVAKGDCTTIHVNQENLYEHQIAILKRIPFLRGMTPWILKDFRSPRRTLPRFEDYFNRKGLVSDHGEKKKAFFVLQEFYRALQNAQPPQ